MIKILIILMLLVTPLYAEDFYVCEGGDGSAPNTATCGTAWDVSHFNDADNWTGGANCPPCVDATETVYLMDDNGTFDAAFTAPGSGDATGDVTITAQTGDTPVIGGDIARCFIATDKEYLTISNITCDTTVNQGVWIRVVNNDLTDITFDNVTVTNAGTHAIHFDMAATKSVTNATISDSTISHWGQNTAGSMGLYFDENTLNAASAFINLQILRNTVFRDNTDNVEVGGQEAIKVEMPDQVLIDGNEIYNTGAHGVWITGGDNATCNATGDTIIRNNYVHQLSDDCFWLQGCGDTDKIRVYSNLCVDSYDDCFDVALGDAWIVNNTCYSPSSNCLDYEGVGTNLTGTFKNNICIFTEAPSTNNDPDNVNGVDIPHYFVSAGNGGAGPEPILSSLDTDNNIFYDLSGTITSESSGDVMRGENAADCPTLGDNDEFCTFNEWQSLTSADGNPDTNSYLVVNPKLYGVNRSLYYPTGGSIAYTNGEDLSGSITNCLVADSTWSVGSPVTVKPCNSLGGWVIGAYAYGVTGASETPRSWGLPLRKPPLRP